MANRKEIPQIASIRPVGRNGAIGVTREIRKYLGVGQGDPLRLVSGDEVQLCRARGREPSAADKRKLTLPADVSARLQVTKGSHVALIQRVGALAIKKLVIEEREGVRASAQDVETPTQVTREVVTNPPPERLVRILREEYGGSTLAHSVKSFLRGRPDLAAWRARGIIGCSDAADSKLKDELVAERLTAQSTNGSWNDEVPSTARTLRELLELGVSRKRAPMRRGAEWLLGRPESPVNLGMFFLIDELVDLQKQCLKQRKRFRDHSSKKEIALCATGDDLFRDPCGQRILWPNALALEALIGLGYEKHPRIQRALRATVLNGWCECAGQHGVRDESGHPPPADTLEEWIDRAIAEATEWNERAYKFGGVGRSKGLCWVDPNTRSPELARTSCRTTRGKTTYSLRLPTYVGPCELVTLRGLSGLKDQRLRRRAEAQLGSLVGRQQADGTINPDNFSKCFHCAPAASLQMFAAYDHPMARAGVMRFIPWIVESQNADGSWGDAPHRDAATLAVVLALHSGRSYLPKGLCP